LVLPLPEGEGRGEGERALEIADRWNFAMGSRPSYFIRISDFGGRWVLLARYSGRATVANAWQS